MDPQVVGTGGTGSALDPNFARGQAHLANSLLFVCMYFVSAPEKADDLLRGAETAVHKALALDPELSEAYGAYANLLRADGLEQRSNTSGARTQSEQRPWHDYAVFLGNFPAATEERVGRRSARWS